MQDTGDIRMGSENIAGVSVGVPVVNDYGLFHLFRQRKLPIKHLLLPVVMIFVPVIIQTDFSYGNSFRMRRELPDFIQNIPGHDLRNLQRIAGMQANRSAQSGISFLAGIKVRHTKRLSGGTQTGSHIADPGDSL